jgi:hypothetical protein
VLNLTGVKPHPNPSTLRTEEQKRRTGKTGKFFTFSPEFSREKTMRY